MVGRTGLVRNAGPWSGSLIDETAGSSLPSDEVLADHLRDLSLKCDGELLVLDAFDLAIAEHGMMHPCGQKTETAENTVSYPPLV